jgi:hypothetical protein
MCNAQQPGIPMPEVNNMLIADGFTEVWIAHGLARITLAQTGPDGKASAVGQRCIPVSQVQSIATAMVDVARRIEEQQKVGAVGAQPAGPR